MCQVIVEWNGESISLPTDGWKESKGDSRTDKEKRFNKRGLVVSHDKLTHMKFFVKDGSVLMALVIEKTKLDKLAEEAKKKKA